MLHFNCWQIEIELVSTVQKNNRMVYEVKLFFQTDQQIITPFYMTKITLSFLLFFSIKFLPLKFSLKVILRFTACSCKKLSLESINNKIDQVFGEIYNGFSLTLTFSFSGLTPL